MTVAKIHNAVITITGLVPVETNTADKYALSLGVNDPIEIGFYKDKHPEVTEEVMRWSAYIKLIQEVSKFLVDFKVMEAWIKKQKK